MHHAEIKISRLKRVFRRSRNNIHATSSPDSTNPLVEGSLASRTSTATVPTVADSADNSSSQSTADSTLRDDGGPTAKIDTVSIAVEGEDGQQLLDPTDGTEVRPQSKLSGNSSDVNSVPRPRSDRWRAAYSATRTVINVAKESADAFPPLKSVLGGLSACIDAYEKLSQNEEDFVDLMHRLERTISVLSRYTNSFGEVGKRSEELISSLQVDVELIAARQNRWWVTRLVEGSADMGEISSLYRNLASNINTFTLDVALSIKEDTAITKDTVTQSSQHDALQELNPVDAAEFDGDTYKTVTSVHRVPCTANTRRNILSEINTWINVSSGPKIFWMQGMAGTGKTTITYSICETLREQRILGANFFCSRSLADCRNVRRIIPSIAYQLARAFPPFKVELVRALQLHGDAYKRLPMEQLLKLVIDPVRSLNKSMPFPRDFVVVLDALDECDDPDAVITIINLLFEHSSSLPLKFLLTSRPEPHLRKVLEARDSNYLAKLILHDIEKHLVDQDIRLFILDALDTVLPSSEQVDLLVQRSARLFIYAATVVRYVVQGGKAHSSSRLSRILSESSQELAGKLTKEIDQLYWTILDLVFRDSEDEEIEQMRLVLDTIICAAEPMSAITIAYLLEVDPDYVQSVLDYFSSVLYAHNDQAPVTILHSSFADFMLVKDRSSKYSCNELVVHSLISTRCMRIMTTELHDDMSHDVSSGTSDSPALLEHVAARVPFYFRYSCFHWSFHLVKTDVKAFSDENHDLVSAMLDVHLLHWFECMSLFKELERCILVLELLEGWLLEGTSLSMVQDGQRFLRLCFDIIRANPMDVYYSALAWAPKQSQIREHYRSATEKAPKVIRGLSNDWGFCEQILQGHTGGVLSVAFSHDESRIVTGSEDNTVRIWSRVGVEESVLRGHTHYVWSVRFSPDGYYIVSGSTDRTIRIWNTKTGAAEHVLEGHSGTVRAVVFSPDGSLIASGSNDTTVRIWLLLESRTLLKVRVFRGHADTVRSVAFSRTGRKVASGSFDGTIRVWDVNTGLQEHVLQGHTDWVRSVAFLDDVLVISGSDDSTVRIWDCKLGTEVRVLRGHNQLVWSVAPSPDGKHIVSGSDDKTIRVWDATGKQQRIFEGHDGGVWSVRFSPNKRHVISGSGDRTVRVWNFSSDTTGESDTQEGHTDLVRCIAFSSDGCLIASGSNDHSVRLWNADNGYPRSALQGHTGWVRCVAFSQDGEHVASGGDDQTVRVWSTDSGELERALDIGESVHSVAYSVDGSCILSVSEGGTVQIWRIGEDAAVLKAPSVIALPEDQVHNYPTLFPKKPVLPFRLPSILRHFVVEQFDNYYALGYSDGALIILTVP